MRQWHQVAHSLLRLNFKSSPRKFGLSLGQDVLETRPQARLGIVAFAKGFAEAVNDRALQGGGKIRGRLRSFRIVPNGALFFTRRFQHAIEKILPRAALKIYQLRHAKAPQHLPRLWRNLTHQGK